MRSSPRIGCLAVCLALAWATASRGGEAPLISRPVPHTNTLVLARIDAAIAAGRLPEAVVAIENLLADGLDEVARRDGTVARMPIWVRDRAQNTSALRTALAEPARLAIADLARRPLNSETLAIYDAWLPLLPSSEAARVVARYRDAGVLSRADDLAVRWGLQRDPAESVAKQVAIRPNPPAEAVARPQYEWPAPLGEAELSQLMSELRLLGLRPRLTRHPVLAGESLYVRQLETLTALDADTLRPRWQRPLYPRRPVTYLDETLRELMDETLLGSPTVDTPTVDTPTTTAETAATVRLIMPSTATSRQRARGWPSSLTTELVAWDAASGQELWRFQPSGGVVLSPGVRNHETIWTALNTGEAIVAVALDAASGTERTRVRIGQVPAPGQNRNLSRQAAVVRRLGGRLVFVFNEGMIVGLDPATERVDWSCDVASRARRLQETISLMSSLQPRDRFPMPALWPTGAGRAVAIAPDWAEVVEVDLTSGQAVARESADGVLDVVPAVEGNRPTAVLVRAASLLRLSDRATLPLSGIALEGSSSDGHRIALPMPNHLAVQSVSREAESRGEPEGGEPATLVHRAGRPAVWPRSTFVRGDDVYVQTFARVERMSAQALIEGTTRQPVVPSGAGDPVSGDDRLTLRSLLGDALADRQPPPLLDSLAAATKLRSQMVQRIGEGWQAATVDYGDRLVSLPAWLQSRTASERVRSPGDELSAAARDGATSLRAWPVEPPTKSSGPPQRQRRHLFEIEVDALAAEPHGVSVQVLRNATAVLLRGPGIKPRVLTLPRNSAPQRTERRLYAAWHRGRTLVLQLGTELFAIRLRRLPAATDGSSSLVRYEPEWGWTETDSRGRTRPQPVATHPIRSQLLRPVLDEQPDPLGGVEFVNAIQQPVDDVLVVEAGPGESPVLVLRQAGNLVAVEWESGRDRWRRFDLAAGERLFASDPVEDDAVVAVVGDFGTRRFRTSDGEEVGTNSGRDGQQEAAGDELPTLTMQTALPRQVGRGPFAVVENGTPEAGRLVRRRRLAADGQLVPWSVPLSPDALLDSSRSDLAVYEPATRLLSLYDREGVRWAAVTLPTATVARRERGYRKQPPRLVVASVPDGAVVGVGRDADPDNLIQERQIGGAAYRPSFTGQLAFVDRTTGSLAWVRDVGDVAIPLAQPRDVPVVVLDYVVFPNRNRMGLGGRLDLYDRRTGEPLLNETTLGHHTYSEFLVDREATRLTVRLTNEEHQLDFAPPPPPPREALDAENEEAAAAPAS